MAARAEPIPDRYRRVLRFVRRRVGSTEDAEDLTQEVFANAAAALGATDGTAPTLAWLYTVAKRRIADEARRRGRAGIVSLDASTEMSRPETDYGAAVARTLDAGLRSMPEGQRRVVVGRLLQGRSFHDLARALDLSEEACRMRFMRGLRHLREEFEKEGLDP